MIVKNKNDLMVLTDDDPINYINWDLWGDQDIEITENEVIIGDDSKPYPFTEGELLEWIESIESPYDGEETEEEELELFLGLQDENFTY